MDFEWDNAKAQANLRKHGVDFADAATVFEDEAALTVPDAGTNEERYATLAADALGRVLVVAYTWRGDRLRIISARKASPSERRAYGEQR